LLPVFCIVTDSLYGMPAAIDVGTDWATTTESLPGHSGVKAIVGDQAAAVVDVGSRIDFTFA
jgi:hypothetical protein